MKPLPVLLLAAVLSSTAQGACRRGGVEWIVGGAAPVDCDPPAAAAAAESRAKVSPASQRQRDEERLGILVQELAQEERQLSRASDAAAARRTRDNIAALKREIARMNAARH